MQVWVFYLSSLVTCIWFLLWLTFLSDYPEDDRFITDQEKQLILSKRTFDPKQVFCHGCKYKEAIN